MAKRKKMSSYVWKTFVTNYIILFASLKQQRNFFVQILGKNFLQNGIYQLILGFFIHFFMIKAGFIVISLHILF